MTEREQIEQQIRLHEGESLTLYRDTVGKLTIGCGHNIEDRGISAKVSRLMLQEDLDEAITDLAKFPWFGTLNAVRQRALIDMRFNLSPSKFRGFTKMIEALEMGDYKRAALEMLHSKWASQVHNRATTLARMMETGVVFIVLACSLVLNSGCTGALSGGVINLPPIVSPSRYPTACIVHDEWDRPVAGATCSSEGQTVETNHDGYALLPDGIEAGERILVATKDGYEPGQTVYTVSDDPNRNGHVVVVLKAIHVDPSSFALADLAAIRGAMWPLTDGACGNLSLGPRPGQPSNVIATVFITDYPQAEQDCIIGELKRRGYTHVVLGPLVDSDGYHGMWAPNDWRGANFDRFLDAVQRFWDAGLIPIVFIKPDNWSLDQMKAELTPLLSQPRAKRLLRLVVPMGWEAGAAYEYSSCTWAEAGKWARQLLPDALTFVHMVSDRDAPAGTDFRCNDDDKTWNPRGNAAAWERVVPFYHGWLAQFGAFDDPVRTGCSREEPSKTNFQCFQDSFNPNVRGSYRDRFEHGYAGWPKNVSAWGNQPLRVYAGEYAAYWKFWHGRTEAESIAWGDAAVRAGAYGYLDSGSVAVPVKE